MEANLKHRWNSIEKENWKFYEPDLSLVYIIDNFDDGYEGMMKYTNKWTLVGESTKIPREFVSLININNPDIVIPNIPLWKISIVSFENKHSKSNKTNEDQNNNQ